MQIVGPPYFQVDFSSPKKKLMQIEHILHLISSAFVNIFNWALQQILQTSIYMKEQWINKTRQEHEIVG